MSFGAYVANIYTQLGLIGLVMTCAFAWWKGGAPERLGTLILAINWVGTDLVRALTGQMVPTSVMFGSEVVLTVGFLFISVRYSSLWLGLAMLIQSFGFALHAIQLGDEDAPRWHGMIVYLLLNNILAYLLLLALIGGTLVNWSRIRRRGPQKAQPRRAARKPAPITGSQRPLAGSF